MINVEDINARRFIDALIFFEEGREFRFDRTGFRLSVDGCLEIYVESSWLIGNVDTDNALADLSRAVSVLQHLLNNSQRFADLVQGKSRRFSLIYFDGRDSVELGHFENDKVIFH